MRFFAPLLIIITFSIFLFGCSGTNNNPVVLPDPDSNAGLTDSVARNVSSSGTTQANYWSEWILFEGQYWLTHGNENGSIDRAFGKGVKVGDSPEEIINSHPDIFKIPFSSMVKVEEYTRDGIRYVFFRQVVNGIQVKDSRIELRWGRHGSLVLLEARVYPEISIVTTPRISKDQALSIVLRDSDIQSRVTELVIEDIDGIFNLVWWAFSGDYKYHIDALSGSILKKESIKLDEHEWISNVQVYPLAPFDTPVEKPYQWNLNMVDVPGTGWAAYYADKEGLTTVASEESNLNIQSYLDSPYVNSIPCDGVYHEGKSEWTSANGTSQSVLFNDDNSHMGQRMVGYDCTVAHDHIKGIDPTYTGMDSPLDAYADCCCTCNAFAYIEPPYKIMMYSPWNDCVATSEVADVIIHEYGHIYVAVQYTLGNPGYDIHEGFADYLANTVTNQPVIGKDITGPGTMFRSSENNVMYDDNECYGESHCVGNIYAAALWEIRNVLGGKYTDHLWHQARNGQGSGIQGFIVDFYTIDDDDDNILNGTPNSDLFYQCFWENHHLPVPTVNPPTQGLQIDVVPNGLPLEMDRTKINNNLYYNLKIRNLDDATVTFQAWAMVETPWSYKYGPMLPPSSRIKQPIMLTLQPLQELEINLRQAVPPMLPLGTYRYHVKAGTWVDNENDVLLDDGWIDFKMY